MDFAANWKSPGKPFRASPAHTRHVSLHASVEEERSSIHKGEHANSRPATAWPGFSRISSDADAFVGAAIRATVSACVQTTLVSASPGGRPLTGNAEIRNDLSRDNGSRTDTQPNDFHEFAVLSTPNPSFFQALSTVPSKGRGHGISSPAVTYSFRSLIFIGVGRRRSGRRMYRGLQQLIQE